MVAFSEGVTVPVDRENLIMEVIRERIEDKHALTGVVGTGSR